MSNKINKRKVRELISEIDMLTLKISEEIYTDDTDCKKEDAFLKCFNVKKAKKLLKEI